VTALEKLLPKIGGNTQILKNHTTLPSDSRIADLRFKDTNGNPRHIAAICLHKLQKQITIFAFDYISKIAWIGQLSFQGLSQ